MIKSLILISLFLSLFSCNSQGGNSQHLGNWEGQFPDARSLNFSVLLTEGPEASYQLQIANTETVIDRTVTSTGTDDIHFTLDPQTRFTLYADTDGKALSGFIASGILMYHITLKKTGATTYTGTWNPFMVSTLQDDAVYLSVEDNGTDTLAAYPFFGDQRFTGTWCSDFTQKGEDLLFRDFKTGLQFKAGLSKDQIQLEVLLAGSAITTIPLSRSKEDWAFGKNTNAQKQSPFTPEQRDDNWEVAGSGASGLQQDPLLRLLNTVKDNKLPNTHSVLIAQKGQLVFEAYFEGYTNTIPHDLRSASKSISSAMIGIAIDDNLLSGVDQKLYDCIPEDYQHTKEGLKSEIRLKDLLTMSSGLDVNGEVSENTYQQTGNWLQSVLEAPMADAPGTHTLYGSANPFLLGVCLNERLEQPMEIYMDQRLLAPLGITNYIIQTDNTGMTPYFGGGMYLTPRDMLKFGQLYLNKGQWNGVQVISESWVRESFQKHSRLEDAKDKNEYGYQWWHKTYTVNGSEIASIEARGAGGQYIFVLPGLDAVAVITSGNFRNGSLLQQPEEILETYILPALQP